MIHRDRWNILNGTIRSGERTSTRRCMPSTRLDSINLDTNAVSNYDYALFVNLSDGTCNICLGLTKPSSFMIFHINSLQSKSRSCQCCNDHQSTTHHNPRKMSCHHLFIYFVHLFFSSSLNEFVADLCISSGFEKRSLLRSQLTQNSGTN